MLEQNTSCEALSFLPNLLLINANIDTAFDAALAHCNPGFETTCNVNSSISFSWKDCSLRVIQVQFAFQSNVQNNDTKSKVNLKILTANVL